MLMAVKNQAKISFITVKYALMREMLNKVTFLTNIIFMILNNACMIVQWIILFFLKDNFGGYTFKQVLLLWALASATYGFSHFFFKNAYSLSDTIMNGKLDDYLVQPKNVLLSAITSDVETSAIGDMLYGLILMFIYGFSLKTFSLFILFMISGGIMLTSIAIMLSSLSFWFTKSDVIADTINRMMVQFVTYPEGIFNGITKMLLFTLVPVGFINYIPVQIITTFNFKLMLAVVGVVLVTGILACFVFYKGLKRYSSSNLMSARV